MNVDLPFLLTKLSIKENMDAKKVDLFCWAAGNYWEIQRNKAD